MDTAETITLGRAVNLVIPGGGLILIGRELPGALIALWFTATADFALAASLLVPDEVAPVWRGLAIGLALGTYLGAQIRYAQTVRQQREQAVAETRRLALADVRGALLAGQIERAWLAIQPLAARADNDLLVAYRLAQILTARGDRPAALAAWRRVRRLDCHRLYRQEVAEHERVLADADGSVTSGDQSAGSGA